LEDLMQNNTPASDGRPLVSPDDDPLFSADRVHCPVDVQRRASISVEEVEAIADRTLWRR
jgi:hypothetical protein